MNLKICDMAMAGGKSTAILHELNNNPAVRHLIIVPYLDEIDRFVLNTNCVAPDDKKGTKSKDIKKLIEEEHTNIVCAHALFELFDDDVLVALKDRHYNIITDEIPNLIDIEFLKENENNDIKYLIKESKISIDPENYNQINWIAKEAAKTSTETFISDKLKYNEIYYLKLKDKTAIIRMIKSEIFSVFDSVMVCTYRFDNSMLDYYCQLHKIDIENYYISQSDNTITLKSNDGEYTINDRVFIKGIEKFNYPKSVDRIDIDFADKFIAKIETEYDTWLGHNYYKNNIKSTKINGVYKYELNSVLNNIKKSANNYVQAVKRKTSKKSDSVMWTCFGSKDKNKQEENYKYAMVGQDLLVKNFIPCNTVASNDYRDCNIVVCLCGVFLNPYICNFFNNNNIKVDERSYTLSMFLQLLWRSNLRVENSTEKVYVYIASPELRKIFKEWLIDFYTDDIIYNVLKLKFDTK